MMSEYIYDDPEAQDILERVKAGGLKELKDAVKQADSVWDMHQQLCFYYAAMYGAIAALNEGRPENMQALLSDPEMIDLGLGRQTPGRLRALLLDEMLILKQEGGYSIDLSSNAEAVKVINIAFEKVSSDEKKEALSEELFRYVTAIRYKTPVSDLDVLNVLLECGADPAFDKSHAFAEAIAKQPAPIVELLFRHGGKFDEALERMEASDLTWGSYQPEHIEKLKEYKMSLIPPEAPLAHAPRRGRHII
jgi:hypothetical protein